MSVVPTRCQVIDNAMGGGFHVEELSEVCGESGSGKTQLCLQAVATTIAKVDEGGCGGSAIYISCMNPFPTRRLQTMMAKINPSYGDNLRFMQKVTTRRGTSPYELLDHVNEVVDMMKEPGAEERNYKIMVIDSMYGFITHHFPDTSEGVFMRTGIIRSLGYGLKRLAAQINVAIIATNYAVDLIGAHLNDFITSGRLVKPGIGLQWDKNLYVRYVLAKEAVPGTQEMGRTFQILALGQYYARCNFTITGDGVCNA